MTTTKDRVFQWKKGARHGGRGMDVEKVGERLDYLSALKDGLTVSAVIEDARKKTSPLHNWFEWDDNEAARKFRMVQAGKLVGAVEMKIVYDGGEWSPPTQAFVNLEHKTGVETRFHIIHEVLGDTEMCGQLLSQAKSEMKTWKRKYSELKELAQVFAAIDDL